jgi:hypothetical protein
MMIARTQSVVLGIDNGDGGPVLGEAQQFPGAPRQLSPR